MLDEIKYVECIDIDNKTIQLPEDSSLYYTKDDKNYSVRYDFNKTFGSMEEYMRTGYEPLDISDFDINQLKKDDYNGKFIYKVILKDSTILTHYYTFIGYESENIIKLAPIKMPKENFFTVNPEEIVSYNWYYIESEDTVEYIE